MTDEDPSPPGGGGDDDDDGDADLIVDACKRTARFTERYPQFEVIGGGQFAVVFKAFAKPWGKWVAAKVMYKRLSDAMREKARQEALCAEAITGPGSDKVVRTHGPHESKNLFWIEMEWVDGTNLDKLLREAEAAGQTIPYQRALTISAAIAEAVQAAHRHGVIHRDIKFANILIPATGSPAAKLGDFGISKIAEISKLSRTGGVPGTPLFMAPEVRRGEPYSKAADVYALGIVTYKLLTGHLPLPITDDHTEVQVAYIHENTKVTPPKQYKPDLPGDVQDLLMRALSKKREQRPSADEFLETLQTALAVMTTEKMATATVPRSTSSRPRRVLAGLILTTGVIALAFLLRGRGPASPAQPAAREAPTTTGAALVTPAAIGVASAPVSSAPTSTLGSPKTTLPPTLFHAAFDQGELSVTNSSTDTITDLQVTLVGAGGRFAARQGGTIKPEESAIFSSDQFTPALPTPFNPDRVELLARAPEGRRVAALALKP